MMGTHVLGEPDVDGVRLSDRAVVRGPTAAERGGTQDPDQRSANAWTHFHTFECSWSTYMPPTASV